MPAIIVWLDNRPGLSSERLMPSVRQLLGQLL